MIMLRNTPRWVKLSMLASLGFCPVLSFANFYTVIGPDGRPIVIQDRSERKKAAVTAIENPAVASVQSTDAMVEKVQPAAELQNAVMLKAQQAKEALAKAKLASAKREQEQLDKEIQQHTTENTKHLNHITTEQRKVDSATTEPVKQAPAVIAAEDLSTKVQPVVSQVAVIVEKDNAVTQKQTQLQQRTVPNPSVVNMQQPVQATVVLPQVTAHKPDPTLMGESKRSITTASSVVPTRQVVIDKTVVDVQTKPANLAPGVTSTATAPQAVENIVEIDGVKYVSSEYLEQREFNLEGKKRFYVMPEVGTGGGHNMQTVEREKGVSRSVMERFWQSKPKEQKPVVLAASYQRMTQAEAEDALEQRCFNDTKMSKAKTLGPKNSELGYWPVAPIKERFVYEVVKLDQSVQNIQLTSYASSQKSPRYYWPFVVFLDSQGCVIEGVTAFKTAQIEETAIHKASLEGVVRKPDQAIYLFMTPLESAVDVDQDLLSNQGQIKLSVIQ